jgi:acyl-CoA dehydrogenase
LKPSAFSAEHEAFRATIQRFVREHIAPHVNDWDEAEEFQRTLYKEAAEIGLLGIGYEEQYGGTPADLYYHLIAADELAQAGSGGLCASLLSHGIGAPPIAKFGSAELKARVLPGILAGEKISGTATTTSLSGCKVPVLIIR